MDELAPEEAEASAQLREYFNNVAAYQGKVFEASSAYNQIIVLGAYAAFFAVWSAVAADIPQWARLTSGGLIILSVIVYVAWTIANMVLMRNQTVRMMAAIEKGPTGFYERVTAVEAEGVRRVGKQMRFWKPVVATAGLSALAAALLLAVPAFLKVISAEASASIAKPADLGRYVISSGPYGTQLLDTSTGNTWEAVRLSDHDNRLVWAFARRLNNPADVKAFIAEAKKPQKPQIAVQPQ